MNSMPFRQLKSFLKILIGVQYEKSRKPLPLAQSLGLGKGQPPGNQNKRKMGSPRRRSHFFQGTYGFGWDTDQR